MGLQSLSWWDTGIWFIPAPEQMGQEQRTGQAKLHPACRKWGFISTGGFGPNQAGNKPLWKCPQTGNSQKGSETSKLFQNTIPKFPGLQLIADIASGSSSSSSTQQLHTVAVGAPKAPWPCAEDAEDTLGRLPRATAPLQGVQELQWGLSQALSASKHGNHCGVQAPSTALLSALQPWEVGAQGHQLEFWAPRPWIENSKAELPWAALGTRQELLKWDNFNQNMSGCADSS